MVNTWNRFEAKAFVEKILQNKHELELTEIPSHENWWELIPLVTKLGLKNTGISDLSPLANLPALSLLGIGAQVFKDKQGLALCVNVSETPTLS